MEIQYIKHSNIDFKKWDNAICNSVNGIVYANSWYLNIVNPGWDALIAEDYKIVMPLTHKSKFGIKYLYKPFFSQFLGVFYKNEDNSKHTKQFIETAAKYFRHININVNVSNSNFKAEYTKVRQTQVLDLSANYSEVKKKYNRSNKKNIRKSWEKDLDIRIENKPGLLIDLIKLMYADRKVEGVTEKDFSDLEKIVRYALSNSLGEVHFAYQNNEVCAAAFFFKWKNRVILQTGINNLGKETLAIFRIMDNYIQHNSGKGLLFDFAGSNLPGVAYWNSGFGAITQHYYNVSINNLPFFAKWFMN